MNYIINGHNNTILIPRGWQINCLAEVFLLLIWQSQQILTITWFGSFPWEHQKIGKLTLNRVTPLSALRETAYKWWDICSLKNHQIESGAICVFVCLNAKMASPRFSLTASSSFSIPLGIWGTARLMAEYSGRSGSSSAKYMGIGLDGSRALARNESFDIFSPNFFFVYVRKTQVAALGALGSDCGQSWRTAIFTTHSLYCIPMLYFVQEKHVRRKIIS